MRTYQVALDIEAERDLEEIAAHVAEHDSIPRAIDLIDRIEHQIEGLASLPNRRAYPKELLEYGNRDFRETYFKSCRILYRIVDKEVVVVLIADERRDMRSLLARRLLGA